MEWTTLTSSPSTSSQTQSPPPPFPPPPSGVIMSPCAACKILRRRCINNCLLAPYFPPTDPLRFSIAHRVFGASNIIKLLQDLLESQRGDAANSIIYEAKARIRDPVYGCAGIIYQLQKQVTELQVELAKTQAELVSMQCQQANLPYDNSSCSFDLIQAELASMQYQQTNLPHDNSSFSFHLSQPQEQSPYDNSIFSFENSNFG